MIKLLALTLLITIGAASIAAAQPESNPPGDFSAIGAGRTVTVVNNAGEKTKGRLLRFSPESLSIAVGDVETTFERQSVSTVEEHGDSLRNGMKIGAIAGGGFGALIGIGLASWASCGYSGCDVGEGVAVAMVPTAIFGLMGLGAGAGIDALNSGHRQLYARAPSNSNGGAADFSGLAAQREIVLVDDAGRTTRGRLILLTADAVTINVGGVNRTMKQQDVKTVFERGDSVKNGLAIGLVGGFATGMAAGASKTTCGRDPVGIGLITVATRYEPCTFQERTARGLGEGTLLGLLGAGLGATIDALIPGRHTLYERPSQARSTTMALVPSIGPSSNGLSVSVSW